MEAWHSFPEHFCTLLDQIAKVVLMLADGEEFVDAKGVKIPKEEATGQTPVANGRNFYAVRAPECHDELMEAVTEGARAGNQAGFIHNKDWLIGVGPVTRTQV
ncbi:hypothetical protein DL771_005944 [Monosporascus sp. 5C6A]|nr:hypothetical protein DL771_005944 [Monosporascus sp. 5C6A]